MSEAPSKGGNGWIFGGGCQVRAKVDGVWVRATVKIHHTKGLRSLGTVEVEPERTPRTFQTVTVPEGDVLYGWE